MSLLDESNARITVYPQVLSTDSDGNPVWVPSIDGVPLEVMVWPLDAAESSALSREPGEAYRVRPARGQPVPVGAFAAVMWGGREWDVHGEITPHSRGRATRRVTFVIRPRTKRPGDGGEE
ncbi:hypothetical protein [Saccharothrix lopnurensis]|uniref:Uncharacterized protein n=1 Tax=Saccharothrix lopnurensis TaxID=1670621 RepID=A0ABW1P7A1_9PSEU